MPLTARLLAALLLLASCGAQLGGQHAASEQARAQGCRPSSRARPSDSSARACSTSPAAPSPSTSTSAATASSSSPATPTKAPSPLTSSSPPPTSSPSNNTARRWSSPAAARWHPPTSSPRSPTKTPSSPGAPTSARTARSARAPTPATPARYVLPYRAGERYPVLQGPGDSFSHFGPMEHALDFDMPNGATVVAMRAGKVAFTHDRATSGANDPNLAKEAANANFVAIEHDDGTIAMYAHLEHRGVLVSPGQRVAAGQPIGRSGDTGFVSKPHLHVALQIAQDAYTARSLPLPILLRKNAKKGTILSRGDTHSAFAIQ